MATTAKRTVGDWLVEPELDRISRNGEQKSLRPQVMELLVYLADRPSQVVSADELLDNLWDSRIVTSGSVYNCVSELRDALTDGGRLDSPIQTIPKKGYRLVAAVAPVGPPAGSDPGSRRPATRAILVSVVSVAVFAIVAAYLTWLPRGEVGDAPVEIRSLAVLPLDNLSQNPEQDEYFTYGMTEALIARLGQMRELKVISRTSAMKLKGSDMTIPEIADALDVDGVIEGSVMTAEDEVRITLQLIDGETDRHLWTNSYVRGLDDVLDLQEEMANSIAGELRLQLAQADTQVSPPPAARTTTSNAAFRAYLKGRFHFNSVGGEAFRTALEFYEQAIALDPDYALAYASRAEACMQPLIIVHGILTLDDCARDAARAIELDENLAEAHAALGFVRMFQWDWVAAESHLERAVTLDPNSVMARQWYAEVFRMSYRNDEALEQIRRAEELDPLNLFVKTMVGWPLFNQRRYQEALAQCDDVLEMDPDYMLAHYNKGNIFIQLRLPEQVFAASRRVAAIVGEDAFEPRFLTASALAISGQREESIEMLTQLDHEGGQFFAAWIASVYLMMGDEDAALARLERGLAERAVDLPTISEPKFDAVRTHPRFRAVSREIGLPEIDSPAD